MTLHVCIVDDSIAFRRIMANVIERLPGVEVSFTAANGAIALRKLKSFQVELLLLDVEMPEMNGIETLQALRNVDPKPVVVMVSGVTTEAADATVQALALGAHDFIRKPSATDFETNIQALTHELVPIIRRVREQQTALAQRPPSLRGLSPAGTRNRTLVEPPEIVAIGASTGGPEALTRVLEEVPQGFPLPIVVVQHMPPVFTASLAERLDKVCALEVREAADEMVIRTGQVLIAPGGRHMELAQDTDRVRVQLSDGEPEHSCRPAVDVLFRSVAECYERILGIIMTGMGRDGTAGMQALKARSCYCITQSEESCVVYGMPRAVDELGLSDESVDLTNIAQRMAELCQGQQQPSLT